MVFFDQNSIAMVLVCDLSSNLVLLCLGIILGTVFYYKHAFQYWKKRNVAHSMQPKLIWGTLPVPLIHTKHLGEFMATNYNLRKAEGYKHVGGYSFSKPVYMPLDPEYIKNVLQRGFHHFTERGFYYNEKDDPLSANLFALGGEKWSFLRAKLSPAFTSGKLKLMLDDVVQCAEQMREAIKKNCGCKKAVNIRDVAECFTIDVIGSCAFGLECNSFKDPDAEFRKQGKKIFYFTVLRTVKVIIAFSFPNFSRWAGITLFDKDSTTFFVKVVKETLQYRKTHNVARKDFLQLLLQLGESEEGYGNGNKQKLSIEELTAQAFIFFAAGFETSSLTLTFCLYELAMNSEIQNKVREEINQVLINHNGELNYDAIMDMKYLNQVVEETLRKYPPVPFISRVCVKDYQVPETNVVIEKGIESVICVLGLHHNSEYYPDPERFDPERFSEENKRKRHPFTFIPFGEGPRICIGLRFGLMQTKIGLVKLLKHYRFSLNQNTDVPLKIEPFSFTLIPKSEIVLDVEEVNR